MDADLRTHERAAATGDVEAQARLLRERLRHTVSERVAIDVECSGRCKGSRLATHGTGPWNLRPCPDCNGTGKVPSKWTRPGLHQSVEIAAYLGDPAARMVVPCEDWAQVDAGPESTVCLSCDDAAADLPFDPWLAGLVRVSSLEETEHVNPHPDAVFKRIPMVKPDTHFLARCALEAGRVVLPVWEEKASVYDRRAYEVGQQSYPRRALDAVSAWMECPCDRHQDACIQIGWRQSVPKGFNLAARMPEVGPKFFMPAMLWFAEATSPQDIQTALRDTLVPWLLG